MQNIERRLTALEANATAEASNLTVVQVFPKDGETTEEAIRKAGHDPDATDIMFVCFVALKPT